MATLDYQSQSELYRERARRFWLGTQAGRVMAVVARDLGGTCHYDAELRRHRAEVPLGSRVATVEYVYGGRSPSAVLTQVRVAFAGPPGCQVMARPVGWRDRVCNVLGFDTARTHDAAFDDAFVLIAADIPRVGELFAADRVRAGLLNLPDAVLVVGGSGQKRVVTLSLRGQVADAGRLRPALDVVAAVLGQLAAMGLAD